MHSAAWLVDLENHGPTGSPWDHGPTLCRNLWINGAFHRHFLSSCASGVRFFQSASSHGLLSDLSGHNNRLVSTCEINMVSHQLSIGQVVVHLRYLRSTVVRHIALTTGDTLVLPLPASVRWPKILLGNGTTALLEYHSIPRTYHQDLIKIWPASIYRPNSRPAWRDRQQMNRSLHNADCRCLSHYYHPHRTIACTGSCVEYMICICI